MLSPGRSSLRRVATAVLLAALASCESASGPKYRCGDDSPLAECHALTFDGVSREYILHVPSSYKPGTDALVIALHGVGEQAAGMMYRTGLSAKADTEGFAIVYPNALFAPLSNIWEWNVFFSGSFGASPPDDIGFLRELLKQVSAQINPDPKRIFVTGMSNGGLMAHRVGVEMGDVVASVAVVSGTLATNAGPSVPNAVAPVSMLIIHGDQDANIPCCPLKYPPTQDETFDYWAGPRANSCSAVSPAGPICAGGETPGTLAQKKATGCSNGVEVQYYQLTGGTHKWYTAPMNVSGVTPYNPLLDATTGVTTNDLVWNFFKTHPKP